METFKGSPGELENLIDKKKREREAAILPPSWETLEVRKLYVETVPRVDLLGLPDWYLELDAAYRALAQAAWAAVEKSNPVSDSSRWIECRKPEWDALRALLPPRKEAK